MNSVDTPALRAAASKKITFLANLFPNSSNPALGTFVKTSADGLQMQGWDVDTITLPSFGKGLMGYARFYFHAFLRLSRQRHPVYIHYVSHSSPPAIAAKLINWNLPIVLHYHGSDGFPEVSENAARRLAKRATCRIANALATVIVAPSEGFMQRMRRSYPMTGKLTFVSASGGVDANTFHADDQVRQDVDFLFAARMIKGKGGLEAASAVRQAMQDHGELKALFVGAGPEREQMESILNELTTVGNVEFIPPQPQRELAKLYRRCKVFLFPSTRQGESLGLTWVEAAMCGALPLVLRNGITENLLPEDVREQLSASDINELAVKALDFLNDENSRKSAVRSLQSSLSDNFSSTQVSAQLDVFLTNAFANSR